MTREEIKKAMRDTKKEVVLKNLHKLLSLVEDYPEYEDCVGYAIEKLEQEPTYVSELTQKAYEDGKKDGYVQAKIEQEPKKGHWIMTSDYLTAAFGGRIDYFKCSCCGEDSLEEGDFCPNCGAKMESEDT